MEKISHIGSLWTITDFRLTNGSQIRLKVGLQTECNVANTHTFYKTYVFKKGYKCRNWIYQFESKNQIDERILNLISKQQLYTAFFNHWQKINPLRFFWGSQINSELGNFSVIEKKQDKLFAF